ncbi:MAG: FUSC family protein [Bryobacteraceae bacterium]|jgi:uncharacterized membrane protein YccC
MSMPSLASNMALAKQAIKTALAGVASLYVTGLLRLPEGYWAAISALIVMQSSVGATVYASRTRLAGTAVGALVGGAFVAMWGVSVPRFGIAAALAFFLCSILRLAESQRLATVTVAIVMLTGRANSPWVVALHRFLEVAIGIVIALVVSIVVWPSRARRSLRSGIAEALIALENRYKAVSSRYRGGLPPASPDLKAAADAGMRRNEDLLQHALRETVGLTRGPEILALLMDRLEGVSQAVESLDLAAQGGAADTYVRTFNPELDRVDAALSTAFQWLAERVVKGSSTQGWPELASAVAELDARIVAARKSDAAAGHPFEEVLRLYSFFLSLKNLAGELEGTHAFVGSERPLGRAA